MSEQKESSVLFSLKELMNLEEDRIKSEEADKATAAAAAEKARLEAERVAREAEEARIRADEERRRLEERRVREEAARLDAIRHAELEKARLETEQRARLEAMAAQQQHERSLEAIKQDEGKKKLRTLLAVGGVLAVLAFGGGGYVVFKTSQDAQAQAAKDAAARTEAEEMARKLKATLEEQQHKTDSLNAQLANAKDDVEKAKLQKQLDDEKAKTETIRKGGGGGAVRASGGGGDAPPKKKCTPGDPLCTDI